MQNETIPAAAHDLWRDSIAEVRERLHLLQSAADDLERSRTIDPEPRSKATSAAAELAATLSLAGLPSASSLARDAETTLNHPGLPQPERLQQQVSALREMLQPLFEQAG